MKKLHLYILECVLLRLQFSSLHNSAGNNSTQTIFTPCIQKEALNHCSFASLLKKHDLCISPKQSQRLNNKLNNRHGILSHRPRGRGQLRNKKIRQLRDIIFFLVTFSIQFYGWRRCRLSKSAAKAKNQRMKMIFLLSAFQKDTCFH